MKRKSEREFFLAGRSLSWGTVAGSILLTNISAVQFVGLNGSSYQFGAMFIAWELFAIIGMVIATRIFLPRYFARDITTITEIVAGRFGPRLGVFTAWILLLSLSLVYLPSLVYAGAIILHDNTAMTEVLGASSEATLHLMAGAIVVLGNLYLLAGGMRFIAVSDTIVAVLFVLFGSVFLGLCLLHLGGGSVGHGLTKLLTEHREHWNPFGSATSPIPGGTLLTGMVLVNVQVWCTSQMILQRALSARSLAEAQKGMLFAAAGKLVFPLFVIVPGIVGLHLFGPDLAAPDRVVVRLAELVLPPALQPVMIVMILLLVVSSFNSGLHSAVTLFTRDIAPGLRLPKVRKLAMGIAFGVALSVLIVVLVPRYYAGGATFFSRMKQLDAVFNLVVLLVVLFSIHRRRHSLARVIGGVSIAALVYFVLLLTAARPDQSGMHWLHGLFIAFAAGYVIVRCGTATLEPEAMAPTATLSWPRQGLASGLLLGAMSGVYGALFWLSHA